MRSQPINSLLFYESFMCCLGYLVSFFLNTQGLLAHPFEANCARKHKERGLENDLGFFLSKHQEEN